MKFIIPNTVYFFICVLPLVFTVGCSTNGAPNGSEIKDAFNSKLNAHRETLKANSLEKLTNISIPEIDSVDIAECKPLSERAYRCKFTISFWVGDKDLQKSFTAIFERSSEGKLTYDLI